MTKIGPLISTSLKSLQTPSVSRTDEILALRICSFYLRPLSPFLPLPLHYHFLVSSISTSMHIYFVSRVRAVERDRSLASRRFEPKRTHGKCVVRAERRRRRRRSAVAQCCSQSIEEAETRVRNVFADVDDA